MTNSHAQAIEKQCSIVAALAAQVAAKAQRQAGIMGRMATQLDAGHNIGSRPPNPLNEIVAAAEEIENRLAGLDAHFRAIHSISGA